MRSRVLVTCRQMIACFEEFRPMFDAAGVDVVLADVPGQQLSELELLHVIPGYDAVIAGDDPFTRKVLEAASQLRVLSRWGIGVDAVDMEAAAELGIVVTNTPGVFDDEVADVTIGYLILLARGLHLLDNSVRAGQWRKIEGRSLAGLTLGVVGLGGIGRATARRGRALGMHVIGSDPSPAAAEAAKAEGADIVTYEELLARSDVVVLNCPLTPATHHLVDRTTLALTKPGVLLVNTARGPVVDEAALIEALESGHVAGAGLDVFEIEPLPADSRLRDFENVILGTHNGSNTREAVRRTSELASRNVLTRLGGSR